MFQPKYTISAELLSHIKRIASLITQLNTRKYPHAVLRTFEIEARNVSAHASTSIEGNPLPLTDVKALLQSRPEHIRDTEREVLNYNTALVWLDKELTTSTSLLLSHGLINAIHMKLMDGFMMKKQRTSYRREPVFVNDPRERKTIYWPPDHQDVRNLMDELVDFIHRNQDHVDPLILAGLFHKQFVIIHPYLDGNGRTVRLVTKALLKVMGLDTFNLFSFEQYYNANITRYFTTVGERGNYYDIARTIDFTVWLEYFTGGIIDELLRVGNELEKEVATPRTVLSKHEKKMLGVIENNGFITDKIYATLTKRAKATRNLDFQKLISLGIIAMHGKGKATYYKKVQLVARFDELRKAKSSRK